jgi:hypothetical protein
MVREFSHEVGVAEGVEGIRSGTGRRRRRHRIKRYDDVDGNGCGQKAAEPTRKGHFHPRLSQQNKLTNVVADDIIVDYDGGGDGRDVYDDGGGDDDDDELTQPTHSHSHIKSRLIFKVVFFSFYFFKVLQQPQKKYFFIRSNCRLFSTLYFHMATGSATRKKSSFVRSTLSASAHTVKRFFVYRASLALLVDVDLVGLRGSVALDPLLVVLAGGTGSSQRRLELLVGVQQLQLISA